VEPKDPEPPGYSWPAFTNWDCVGAKAGLVDWDALYALVLQGFKGETGVPQFVLPEAMIVVLSQQGQRAFRECPLGTLYFAVLYTYELIGSSSEGQTAVQQAENLKAMLRRFPFFVIAGTRWPTFEALNHFSHLHQPQNPKAAKQTLCEGVKGASGINWDSVLMAAKSWSDDQLRGLEPGEGDLHGNGQALKAAADQVYRDPAGAGSSAQDECPFGFLFLCTTQVLAAAMRLTGSFEPWARALDKMLAELPFFSIAGSYWPTFRMLAMFSSLSKGDEGVALGNFQADIYRWGGSHPQSKRFRQYGDLRLSEEELCPLGRNEEGWKAVDQLVILPAETWYSSARHIEGARPIVREALDAVVSTVRAAAFPGRSECGHSGIGEEACQARGCRWGLPQEQGYGPRPWCRRPMPARKVVGVTFVWGEKWAAVVPRFVAWAAKLSLSVIIVAMGEACRRACQIATMSLGNAGANGIACWDPLKFSAGGSRGERGSILQRHAIVHMLLHLGIDALAFDFDTFLFEDPRPRLEALADAEGADVLMTRHLDADCLNMGLIYIRASSRSAKWYSLYLDWLHQHPFEREQRGANAMFGFTGQKVSFMPKGMPKLKAVSLDDANEFASSRGGWLGDWSKLRFFHWVNPASTHVNWSEIKVSDLKALYEAALHHSTDLSAAGHSLARILGAATADDFLRPVRDLMDSMVVPEAPVRQPCW